jgi:hypothetical protein
MSNNLSVIQRTQRIVLNPGGNGSVTVINAGPVGPPGVGGSGSGGASIYFDVKDYGAIGNGVANDTTAIQNALNAAQAVGGTTYFPEGNYLVTSLVTAQSFTQPSIRGAGMRATTLTCSGAGPIIKMVGGSGSLCGAVVSDMKLTGSSATGIELHGTGGVTVDRVWFKDLSVGLLFHNDQAGSFTEFNVANRCVFASDTPVHIEYRRTSGNDSFHGSGFTDCVFNQSVSATDPLIKIGSGCSVYNAPWTGQFFALSTEPIVLSSATISVNVYGTINIEATEGIGAVFADGTEILLQGGVLGTTGFSVGKLKLVSRATRNADGSTSSLEISRSETFNLTTGLNTLSALNAGTWLVNVYTNADNYEYDYTLIVFSSRYDSSGKASVVFNNQEFNVAPYGPSTFSFSGGALKITNASFPTSGVTALVTATQIGSWATYPLL